MHACVAKTERSSPLLRTPDVTKPQGGCCFAVATAMAPKYGCLGWGYQLHTCRSLSMPWSLCGACYPTIMQLSCILTLKRLCCILRASWHTEVFFTVVRHTLGLPGRRHDVHPLLGIRPAQACPAIGHLGHSLDEALLCLASLGCLVCCRPMLLAQLIRLLQAFHSSPVHGI